MIAFPSSVRVWLAVGRTDMRRGMQGLALQVQEAMGRDPHAGDLYVFRGARGDLIKIIWHDGIGMSLYSKRLEKGRLYGPRRRTGSWRSRRLRSATCSTESTGETRAIRFGQQAPDKVTGTIL
jgi:transposase